MKLKEYNPKDILISRDAVTSTVMKYSEKEKNKLEKSKYFEISITLGVELALNLLAFIPGFDSLSMWIRVISVIILLVLIVYLSICVYRFVTSRRALDNSNDEDKSVEDMLLDKAKENMRYTAIIRVVYKENDTIKYLIGKDNFLPHGNMDKNFEIDKQGANILQSLSDEFKISQKDILKIWPVDNKVYFSIKPIHGTIQMNAFVFYDINIKANTKAKVLNKNRKRWFTIEEMKQNPDAISVNSDVIGLLEGLPNPRDSFVSILGDVKIIWNITSKCPYNCAICATHDENRVELNASEKLKVLNQICTAKDMIKCLDFAGGDPLHNEECTNIIQAAIEQLGADKISITTTGAGVVESDNNDFVGVVKHCEITIDASHADLSDTSDRKFLSRDEKGYTSHNIEQIGLLLEHTDSLTINVPIINDDLDDNEINELVKRICEIKRHNADVNIDVSLLRLMPVGKIPNTVTKDFYKTYNPINVINKIKAKLEEKGIVCRLHCSLRVLPGFGESDYCRMLENKIGIDCAGNVFACAWGGYIHTKEPITQTPFYLGNLKNAPLDEILDGKRKTMYFRNIEAEMKSDTKRHFCSVVSYYMNNTLFENNDPLSK